MWFLMFLTNFGCLLTWYKGLDAFYAYFVGIVCESYILFKSQVGSLTMIILVTLWEQINNPSNPVFPLWEGHILQEHTFHSW